MSDLLGEARLTIAALLRGAELVLKQGIILGADYGEVVAHRVAICICRWAVCFLAVAMDLLSYRGTFGVDGLSCRCWPFKGTRALAL